MLFQEGSEGVFALSLLGVMSSEFAEFSGQ